MMKRYQIKCRRCRHWLMTEDSIVDCHGDIVQGEMVSWYCNDEQEQSTNTHLFVSSCLPPPFILNAVEEAFYTRGKVNCPKCQGRLGSFDFVRSSRRCACGRTQLPPIHILCDRVDLLPVAPAYLDGRVVMPGVHSLKGTNGQHGTRKDDVVTKTDVVTRTEAVVFGTAASTVVVERDTENHWTAETDPHMAVIDTVVTHYEKHTRDRSVNVGEGGGSDEDTAIMDLCWLFGQLPPCGQQGSDSINACGVQRHSDRYSEMCSDSSVFLSKEWSGISSGGTELHCCKAMQSGVHFIAHSEAKNVLGLQVRPVEERDSAQNTTGLDLALQRLSTTRDTSHLVATTCPQDSALCTLSKKERRERRRKRNRYRDGSELDGITASPVLEPSVHLSSAEQPLIPSFSQRERERRNRGEEERRQIQEEDVQWDHSCPMCLDVMWSPHTTLPCAHNFCEGCLRRLTAVTSPAKCSCPLCRQRIADCVPNTEIEVIIQHKYPAHLRVRRREERRRHTRHFKHNPLPGLPYPQRFLCKFRTPGTVRRFLNMMQASKKWLALVVLLVIALSSVGLEMCMHVMGNLATVYNDLTEHLTGEKLWLTS